MLSYQHSYHAGNLADVHKHAALAVMLDYLTRKKKPLSYIETHAGRGLYALDAAEAVKTGEAAAGIGRALQVLPADHPYRRSVENLRARYGAAAYPGSPLLAALLLRPSDRLHLAELHPQEFAALKAAMSPYGASCRREDGLKFALSITPPEPRRGLMLIDPSFEVKAEYGALPPLVAKIHAKWNVGIVALWYPILASDAHAPMLAALEARGLPKTLRHEVSFPPARGGRGMLGSGLFVVNAPYGLAAEAERLSALFASLT
ncbi:Ribosomal RNA large subunit methyltransferase J [Defluviimonas aquaemixtae]|uniref:Ribosomal RNA large subunit methyltransferase J n=1 Tax=Albidovulum aquaemixtae TaxID=1542388 RepID=A0A2R8B462_9RHOB|nr:23S rRNA (adenine(2030)-N(6))-methyltransferase RlmJ [Defluviimonas aquaemixtae]SPH17408.1 Ribosomal RNA large subunit methyltransferase J [Defluviimonas aquaemixtae]